MTFDEAIKDMLNHHLRRDRMFDNLKPSFSTSFETPFLYDMLVHTMNSWEGGKLKISNNRELEFREIEVL